MRIRQPGMSPEKIAIAVAVTIDAMAGTGGMKNVTGTRSAVAMVAVRPGIAPPNRPKMAETRMTTSVYGSKTRAKAVRMSCISPREALEHAPWQRHAQQLVEQEVDHQRCGDRDDDGGNEPHLELEEEAEQAQRRGGQEPKRI